MGKPDTAQEIEAFNAYLANVRANRPEQLSVAAARRIAIAEAAPLDDTLLRPAPHTRSSVSIPSVGVYGEWTHPAISQGIILHAHGAMQNSCPLVARRLMGDLAGASSCSALCLDYRRPPENRYLAQLEDMLAALDWLRDTGNMMSRTIVSGDSSGGGLALASVLAGKAAGLPLPAGILLMCPMTDYSKTPRRPVFDPNPDTCPAMKALYGTFSAGEGADFRWIEDTVQASPFFDDLSGLPPVLIQTATGDVSLYPHALALRDKLVAAGNACMLQSWDGLPHNFMTVPQFFSAAAGATSKAGVWIKSRLELS